MKADFKTRTDKKTGISTKEVVETEESAAE
jgi:hypothetical protein